MAYQIKEMRDCPTCGRPVPLSATSGRLRKHFARGREWCSEGQAGQSQPK